MIANIMKNSKDIISTFPILGIAKSKAWTATLRPWFLDITLSGLRILSSLIALKTRTSLLSVNEIIENQTIVKSIMFHPFLI